MYATIEADIENGVIHASQALNLPSRAHVLITLLSSPMANTNAKHDLIVGRTAHPALKHSMELSGDLVNTVPSSGWDLPQ